MISALRGSMSLSLGILALISFVSSLGISIMLPLLPLYGLELGASPIELGLMTSGFAVANSMGQLGAGWSIDRFGSRRFILGGTAVYALANVLIATAPTAWALIAFRTLAGLGGGANIVATRLYIAETAAASRLAFTNSLLSASNSAGNVLGPALGGLVAVASDLRMPFRVVAGTSTVALLTATLLPRPPRSAPATGTRLGGVTSRNVMLLLVANLFLLVGFGGWITSYAPFATSHLGWTTFDVGIIFTLFGIGDITLGPWLGHLADRTGRRRMAVLATIPLFFFGFSLVLAFPRPVFYAIAIVTGASLTAYNASWFALLTTAVPRERRGRVFGTVNAIAQAGTVIGALGASALWQAYDVGYGIVMASVASLLAGAVLLFLPRGFGVTPAESAVAAAPASP